MEQNLITLALLSIVVINLIFTFVFIKKINNQNKELNVKHSELTSIIDTFTLRVNSAEKLTVSLQQKLSSLQQQQSEIQPVIDELTQFKLNVEPEINELYQHKNEHANLLQLIQSQNSEQKLYTRAKKMIEMGADIEEIVSECEMPRAEAELLISLYKK